jgi:hypothetical protein
METVIRPFAMQGKNKTAGWLHTYWRSASCIFWRYLFLEEGKKATVLIFVWRRDSVHAAS